MKYAILGDVHANYDALETVVEHAMREGVTEFTCVGDVVGYGPEPSRCIALLKEIDAKVVSGNHDWAVLEKLDVSDFNPVAKESIFWTQGNITEIDRQFLDNVNVRINFAVRARVTGRTNNHRHILFAGSQ